ncbi:exo 1,3/1,4-beta-D-glucan glucohydrolase [Aliikangiella sp. G2MR2-5]|uniref:glycoside hydrolase family 3 protein n=1 Tax=Aliikangiella sp. G2MR2-5 TaxID=2788943 RepID=UPI0018AAB92F|nr:exo 1,3/1,4-beta-D-glucan glucohydrolase [Aliikangiella sp. G2MR2-5]
MKNKTVKLLVISLVTFLSACASNSIDYQSRNIDVWPKLNIEVQKDSRVEKLVSELLKNMTIEQKVAQMIQPEIRDITVEDMRKYGFGSYLNGGGAFPNNNKHSTPKDWIALAEKLYQASIDDSLDGSKIPTMWGTDAVHGHNNVIGATLFPHNIGLGAANNAALIEKIAQATATEVMATGIDWVFAPTVATVRDDRWGRTYEGYSEDPEIVREYARAIVYGLQGRPGKDFMNDNRVISTVKHFLGDGGTIGGNDQGNNIDSETELYKVHAQGYVSGLTAGAQTVMASFNSWHGKKNHGNSYLLTRVLKDRMGFDGLVVGDWNGHGQIEGCTNESCPQSINAGLDIFMAPTSSWKPLFHNTVQQVKDGVISMSRIDDAVSRILRVKVRAGLFEKPSPANRKFSGRLELIGAKEHREIAKQAVRESMVLLKNHEQLLPLNPKQKILVAGDGADNIGKQSGGWTVSWQGTGNSNDDFPGGSSIYDGIAEQVHAAGGKVILSENGDFQDKPDVAIVVFGEEPYAEGHGDIDDLEYQRGNKKDLALLKKLKSQGIPVVSLFISGRPLWVNAELNQSDAFVALWLPGSEGNAVAEVLFTDAKGNIQHDFKGKLSFSWPAKAEQTAVNRNDREYQPLLPYGFGLKYGDSSLLSNHLSEQKEMSKASRPELVILGKKKSKPWRAFIGSSEGRKNVTSSVEITDNVELRKIDRFVQEDVTQIYFKGRGKGLYGFSEDFPNDFRGIFETNAVLKVEMKINQAPQAKVDLAMYCEPDCHSRVNINKQLAANPTGKWTSISIPLSCFDIDGFKKSKVVSPFVIESEGEFQAEFYDLRIIPDSSESDSGC